MTAEDDKAPSITALWRHWLRCCWIVNMWDNCCEPYVYGDLGPPQENGWLLEEGHPFIDWECSEVSNRVKNVGGERVQLQKKKKKMQEC